MITQYYLGLDPGKKGGISLLSSRNDAKAFNMPQTELDIYEMLNSLKKGIAAKATTRNRKYHLTAILEQVHSMPGQGVASTFTFGRQYGWLEMALGALKITRLDVTPQRWQKAYNLPTLKACNGSSTVKKNAHKQQAQRLFTHLNITHSTSDALLIAHYQLDYDRARRGRVD